MGVRKADEGAQRDIGLARLRPLLAAWKRASVSLQKGEKPDMPAERGASILDWMDSCGDFLETRGPDRAARPRHQRRYGGRSPGRRLAKPVWLLNRFESAWQWLTDREDSPWYPER